MLTANRRLANYLQREYAIYQQSLGKTVWTTPTILPLNTWLRQLWTQQHRPLLSDFQERCLWKKISNQPWSSIPLIQQAWNNLALWNIPLNALNDQHNDTTDTFLQWAKKFQNVCKKQDCQTSAEIPSLLITTKQLANLPKQCVLLGFDDLPPAVELLFDSIKKDCTIKRIDPSSKSENIQRLTLENTEIEIQSMAHWAREHYQNNPHQKIGCIVPNLTQIRAPVFRIFTEALAPFNISAAQALTEFPLIQIAINVLQLCQNDVKQIAWEILLQSPYLSATEEDIDVGAFVDAKRRKMLDIDFPLSALLPIFTALHTRFPQSTWLNRWHQFMRVYKNLPIKKIGCIVPKLI